MINASQAWKDNVYSGTDKKIIFTIGDVGLTDDDIQGNVELQETCTNANDIKIGSCIASMLKFNVTNTGQTIDFINNDISVQVGIKIPSTSEFEFVSMGIFLLDSVNDKDERVLKITCRDRMKLFDKDCTEFLTTRIYPVSLWNFTNQLCNYVGIELENTTITNGAYLIENNFSAQEISGLQILSWIGEVAGSFVNVNRYGKLVFKNFTNTIVGKNITDRDYINFEVAKYSVPQITRLQVAVQENDLGVIVGSGNITYSIINNPLLYTNSAEILIPVMNNILVQLQAIPVYYPVKAYGKGNPAIETGDILNVVTVKGQAVKVLVMNRKLIYKKSFRDTYESFGTTTVGNKRIVHSNIIQLKGKMNILTRTLEGNILKVADLEAGYNEIVQTVNELSIEVADMDLNNIATYYQTQTPTENIKPGDIWYNPGSNYIVDNLTMKVDEMLMTVDELIVVNSALKRWNGTAWEEIKDKETVKNVADLNVRADEISLKVASAEGNIGELQLTATELSAQITNAEGNIANLILSVNNFSIALTATDERVSELILTVDSFEARVTDAEGNAASAILKAEAIELAVSNTKVTIDSTSGVTIKNGGLRILNNSNDETFRITSGGAIEMQGELYNLYGQLGVRLYQGKIDFTAGNSASTQTWFTSTVGSIYGYYYSQITNIRELIIAGYNRTTIKSDYNSAVYYQMNTVYNSAFIGHDFYGNIRINNYITFGGKQFKAVKSGTSLTASDYVMVAN